MRCRRAGHACPAIPPLSPLVGCLAFGLALAACAQDAPTEPVVEPPPLISGLAPGQLQVGAEERTVVVAGAGFDGGAQLLRDGDARPTRVLSPSRLEGDLTAADVAAPDTVAISVRAAGGVSGSVPLLVVPGPPTVTAVLPTELTAGTEERTLQLVGTGFTAAASVERDGSPRPTRVDSPERLTADLTAADVAEPGRIVLRVRTEFGVSDTAGVSVVEAPAPFAVHASLLDGGLIDVGRRVTCAVSDTGEVLCWGGRWTDDPTRPQPVVLPWAATAVQVSARGDFACALGVGGEAACWGRNDVGQLGRGSLSDRGRLEPPAPVSGGHRFVDVDAADEHACGVTEAGGVLCWGGNSWGQLGYEGAASAEPVAVAVGVAMADVALRRAGSCALDTVGNVFCWGRFTWWASDFTPPRRLGSSAPLVSLTARDTDACGVTADGEAHCFFWWDRTIERDPDLGARRFLTLAVARHACGADLDRKAWCWGMVRGGELGAGGGVTRSSVGVPVVSERRFVALAVADGHPSGHSCGITESGDGLCWGSDRAGQLGSGGGSTVLEPLQAARGMRFRQVGVSGGRFGTAAASQGASVCGIDIGGDVYCWGIAPQDELRAVFHGWSTPRRIEGARGARALAVMYGGGCALDASDRAVCWGATGGSAAAPSGSDLRFDTLVAGGRHVCGLDGSGAAHCWGEGAFGRLGDGRFQDAPAETPVTVAGGHTFRTLTAGEEHTCGIDEAGATWCWGHDRFGQLGVFTSVVCPSGGPCAGEPVPVLRGLDFVRWDAGVTRTCGIDVDGRGWCWGGWLNDAWCEGRVLVTCSDRPVEEAPAGRYVAIVSAGERLCGLDPAGVAHCWGRGPLGSEATLRGRTDPVRVGDGRLAFGSLTLGQSTSCGVSGDGTVQCWGSRADGELGDGWSVDRWVPRVVAGGHRFRTRTPDGG